MSKIYIRATRGWVNKFDFSSFDQEVIITNPTQDWSKDTTGSVLSNNANKIRLFEPIKNTYFNNNKTFADIISVSERRE